VADRSELVVIVSSTDYPFTIQPLEDGEWFGIEPRTWEDGDPKEAWRVPLHDWDEGLGPDRFKGQKTYAKANADLTNPGIMVPPPLLNTLETSGSNLFNFTPPQLRYGGTKPYGAYPYMGGISSPEYIAGAELAGTGKYFFGGGRFLYSIDGEYTITLEKDFGSGKQIFDIEPLNSELIIAMGESEKIWKYDGTDFTQASDNVFARALGRIGDKLWKADDTNQLANCITTPLTLSNWVPSTPNEYVAGDTSYAIKGIIEYAGFPWAEKADGLYAPDSKSEFKNQTPQVASLPDQSNTKDYSTAFTAWGFLFFPTTTGLLRVQIGESLGVGPEKTGRPDYRWHVHGGIQIGDEVYLLASDSAHNSEAVILKMLPVSHEAAEYTYHELVRLGTTEDGGFIGATSIPTPSNPSAVICSVGGKIFYIKLGRGGGRNIDDAEYSFGTVFELQTGLFSPSQDLTLINMLVGVETVLDMDSGESVTLTYGVNGATPSNNLLTTQEGSGSAPITNTGGYAKITRYAPADTNGQFFEIKVAGTLNASKGTDRPEIRELWAYGYSHHEMTDIITVNILASEYAIYQGLRSGDSSGEIERQWRKWMSDGTVLTIELPDYEEGRTVRFLCVSIDSKTVTMEIPGSGDNSDREILMSVQLMRVDYANAYAAA
jgi:hypothetical protein